MGWRDDEEEEEEKVVVVCVRYVWGGGREMGWDGKSLRAISFLSLVIIHLLIFSSA